MSLASLTPSALNFSKNYRLSSAKTTYCSFEHPVLLIPNHTAYLLRAQPIFSNQTLKQSLQHHQFRAGGYLHQMPERQQYAPYSNFREYVVGELRISEVQAYRLINAYQTDEKFRTAGLPRASSERQIRPLRILEKKNQLLAWKRASKMSQTGNPTYLDVQREVNRIHRPLAKKTLNEGFRSYRKHLFNIDAELKRVTDMMIAGDLEEFLMGTDKTTSGTRPPPSSSSPGWRG